MAQTTRSPKPRRAAAKRAARARAPKPRSQQLAERAVLIPVGAALEARDRVAGTVGDLVTTTRSRRELERQLKRFERRGGNARKSFGANVEGFSTRVEKVVQNGLDAGMKLVNGAQDRLPKVV